MAPIYYFAALFVIGVLVSYSITTSTTVIIASLLLIFPLLIINTVKEKRLHIICVAITGILLGMLCVNLNRGETERPKFTGERIIFDGYVRGSPKYNRNSTVYNISVERYILGERLIVRKFELTYRVKVPFADPIRGDLVRGICKVLVDDEGRIYCIADDMSPPIVVERRGFTFLNEIDEYKKHISRFIFDKYSGDIADILLALATGNSSELRYYTRSIFSKTGTAHILAISGTHIGLISVIFYFLFRLILLPLVIIRPFSIKKVAAPPLILTLISTSIYFGDSPSVVRATIMIIVYLFSLMIDRGRDVIASLSIAFVLIVAFDPNSIEDIGFQLSFLSVAGIVIFVPSVIRWDHIEPSSGLIHLLRPLAVLFLSSLSASLFTLPIVAYHFGIISLIGPIANIIILPFIGFISLPLILAGTLLYALSPSITEFLYNAAFVSLGHFFEINLLLADTPLSFFKIFRPSYIEIVIYYAILISFIFRDKIPFYKIVIILQVFLLVMVSLIMDRIYLKRSRAEMSVRNGTIVAIDEDLRAHLIIDEYANNIDVRRSVALLRKKRIVKTGYTNLGSADDLYIKDHLYTHEEKGFILVSQSKDALINFMNKYIYLFYNTGPCPPREAAFVIVRRVSKEAIERLFMCNIKPERLIISGDIKSKNIIEALRKRYGESSFQIPLCRDEGCEIRLEEK